MTDNRKSQFKIPTPYIYEAAFLAVNTGYFDGTISLSVAVIRAMERILAVSSINSKNCAISFLEEHDCFENFNGASMLLERVDSNYSGFFSSLTPAELFVYHNANYDLSFLYGQYLSKCVNMKGFNIADIGGSSGGLLSGINSCVETGNLTVFDTAAACEARKVPNIDFIPCDFFTYDFNGKYRGNFHIVILSNVLHDWPDSDCIKLLTNISYLLKHCKYLIIHEDLLFNNEEPLEAIAYGLRLSINVPGGEQRSISALKALLEKAGINATLDKIYNFGPLSSLIFTFQ